MKLIHTGDLHIGKTMSDFSLIPDQRFILDQLLAAAREEKADAFVIAGDVYDRAVPPGEAVQLLDSFLTSLLEEGIPVLLISGNHDSPERLGGNPAEAGALYCRFLPDSVKKSDAAGCLRAGKFFPLSLCPPCRGRSQDGG